jgi:hypothetical protein
MPDDYQEPSYQGGSGLGDDVTRRVTSDELKPDNLQNPINPLQQHEGVEMFPGADMDKLQASQPAGYDPKKKVGGPQPLAANPNNPSAQPTQSRSFRDWARNLIERRNKKGGEKGSEEEGEKQGVAGKAKGAIEDVKFAQTAARAAAGDVTAIAQLAKDPKQALKQASQLVGKYGGFYAKMVTDKDFRNKIIIAVVIAIILPILAIVGLISSENQGVIPPDNLTLSGVGVPYGKSWANPNAMWLKIMTPAISVNTGRGKIIAPLESTFGRFSSEEDAVGQWPTNKVWYMANKEPLALSKGLSRQDMDYYVTARFPYRVPLFDGEDKPVPKDVHISSSVYAGRKMVIVNIRKQIAVIGIAAEWGNAPWAGVCTDKDSTDDSDTLKKSTGDSYVSCAVQRTDWKKAVDATRVTSFVVPSTFRGRIAGGPRKLKEALQAEDDELILFGFLDPKYYDQYSVGQVININSDMLKSVGN